MSSKVKLDWDFPNRNPKAKWFHTCIGISVHSEVAVVVGVELDAVELDAVEAVTDIDVALQSFVSSECGLRPKALGW